jgi:predicted oxidoreductase
MEKNALPNTDLSVSQIIAECMRLGSGWKKDSVLDSALLRETEAFIAKALELGTNFFDHADIYAWGRAEEIFSRVLASSTGLRSKMVLQTKCSIRWADNPPGSPHRFDFSKAHILETVEGPLRRLRTDYLGTLLRRPDVFWEGEEIAEAFALLKASGKVRYFGVSNQNRGMRTCRASSPTPSSRINSR